MEQVLSGKRVLLMPERVGYAFYLRLEAAKAQIIEGENPSILRKSVKNAVQLETTVRVKSVVPSRYCPPESSSSSPSGSTGTSLSGVTW